MATEQYPPTTAPPPVADRRAPERRSYPRRAEDRLQFTRTAAAAALAVSGGLAVVFIFFWALGAIDVKNAVAATLVASVFGLVWLVGFLYRARNEGERLQRYDRER